MVNLRGHGRAGWSSPPRVTGSKAAVTAAITPYASDGLHLVFTWFNGLIARVESPVTSKPDSWGLNQNRVVPQFDRMPTSDFSAIRASGRMRSTCWLFEERIHLGREYIRLVEHDEVERIADAHNRLVR